jgi:hypothetical protein
MAPSRLTRPMRHPWTAAIAFATFFLGDISWDGTTLRVTFSWPGRGRRIVSISFGEAPAVDARPGGLPDRRVAVRRASRETPRRARRQGAR